MQTKRYRIKEFRRLKRALIMLVGLAVLAWGSTPFTAGQVGLPDLIVLDRSITTSLDIVQWWFNFKHCAVFESCTQRGKRKLMRFDVFTANIGTANLELGEPARHPELYEFSQCHRHYHLKGFAEYALLINDMERTVVVTGRKQGFCLSDSFAYLPNPGPSAGYTCDYQGLSAGWGDIYQKNLDCQWLDITDVPPGPYLLRVTINPEQRLVESDYTNNIALVPVTIPETP